MNIKKLRLSLKKTWLDYYRKNRGWLVQLGVWVTYQGQRRPSSSFILATLSTLEPKLTQLLPLIVDLSSSPDRIVVALGLNFNPDDELERLHPAPSPKMLPSRRVPAIEEAAVPSLQAGMMLDEACTGIEGDRGARI